MKSFSSDHHFSIYNLWIENFSLEIRFESKIIYRDTCQISTGVSYLKKLAYACNTCMCLQIKNNFKCYHVHQMIQYYFIFILIIIIYGKVIFLW